MRKVSDSITIYAPGEYVRDWAVKLLPHPLTRPKAEPEASAPPKPEPEE
jgi:hypothetical protein